MTNPRIAILISAALVTAFAFGLLRAGEPAGAAEAVADATPALGYTGDLLIQFRVSDLDRAHSFYGDVLGFEFVDRRDDLQWMKFRIPGTDVQLGLGSGADPEGSGTTSLNVGVSNIDRARGLLESRGIEFRGPTIDIPGVVTLADFDDPDGNRIRLAGPPR